MATYRNYLILDARVLLNLLASEVIREILTVAAKANVICFLVEKECLYLRNEEGELHAANLIPLIEENILQICTLSGEREEQQFVNFASVLDDGEAMSLSLALCRNWHLATDDKKVKKIFLENSEDKNLLVSTSGLIKEWVDIKEVDTNKVKLILERIQNSARFRPSLSHSHYQWWCSFFQ